ncbi:hypothetical protein C0J52_14551 [Blattella germanica]|nr:hypothetical protein C0J52_14551 [Blattella germanica]
MTLVISLKDILRSILINIVFSEIVFFFFSDDDELCFPTDDEQMLLQFLRPCKFYPESAYQRMKDFYTFRFNNPKYYGDLTPSKIKNPILQDVLTVLPLRSQNGRRIFVVEVGKWNVKKVSLDELFKCILLLVEIAITEDRTQICGVDVIFDLQGLTIQHVCQIGPSFASCALHWAQVKQLTIFMMALLIIYVYLNLQDCVPLRLKGVYMVNQPYLFNMLFAIFKPFINEKLRKRIFFHGKDYDSLLKHIDGKYLPTTIGGEMDIPSFNRNELYKLFCSYESRFEDRLRYGYKTKPT